MNMAITQQGLSGRSSGNRYHSLDYPLLLAVLALISIGLVMVSSASITLADRELGQPFHYAIRQGIYIVIGLMLAAFLLRMPLRYLEKTSFYLLLLSIGLLFLVLIPGVGVKINGSYRWINLGPVNLQVSEPAKLLFIIYMAGYLVRHAAAVQTSIAGFLKPMAMLGLVAILLLMEPDFGSAVVVVATNLCMLYLAGVRLLPLAGVFVLAFVLLAGLAISSPYRLERLTTFLNPWADPFDSGFQLTQSLIAIGRGEIFGVGLGASIQKLFYLPEAHTDFVFAVLAEEAGLVGVLVIIALYGFLVIRAFAIAAVAQKAGRPFAANLAWGIGTWFSLQSFINLGVNMGLLPTKGLTLPLMSYGGSSMVVMCAAAALLLRIDYETRCTVEGLPESGATPAKWRRTDT